MEFSSGLGRLKRSRGHQSPAVKRNTCCLHMYSTPADGVVSLSDFDAMALERLKVLRCIERHNLSGTMKGTDEWVTKIYEDFNKTKNFIIQSERISESKAAEVADARRRDHQSHFILRLAYCRTEELRRWFVSQEVDLLRVRFLHTANTKQEIMAFCKDNDLYFNPISDEEFQKERENLLHGTHRIGSGDQLEGRSFYKVPFTDAMELVRNRRVFIKLGYAYVPDTELITLITAVYRTRLSKDLTQTCRALPSVEDDERLTKILLDFDKRYTGNDYNSKRSGTSASVTPEMLDTLASKSFPLCMRKLHETLNSVHHLKHGGRMQYGLFLKAAGLSLEDAMHFWRSHFTKNMDMDKFDKQYAYSIRHNYGKEGKRTDYSPYSCMKIISGSVGPGDAHGCPFKLSDGPLLKQRLTSYGLPSVAVTNIVELAGKGHYQVACQKYWEAVHKSPLEVGINHPNQYLEESRKFAAGETGGSKPSTPVSKADIKTRRSVVPLSSQSSPASQTPIKNSNDSNTSSSESKNQINYDFDDELDLDFEMIDASIEKHNAASSQ